MISGDDKPVCIRAGRNAANQVDNLCDCLLTSHKHLIFGIGLVSTGINLIVVHIHDLFSGEDTAQIGNLEGLDTVKLDANAVRTVLLQNRFPFGKVFAGKAVDQHFEIVGHRQFRVRKQRRHTKTGIGRHNTELYFQFRHAFGIILHPSEQFFAHLIAHGIRDDDYRALLGILQIAGIEVPLQGQCHKCVRLLNGGIPLGKQRFQILVGVDVFHQIAQRL